MAVIWGLDLKEMQWGKFKGSYMFSPVYHLRPTKMIVYQIAMILCIISESVGTSALSDYVDQQDGIQTRNGRLAHVQNNNIVGILSYNIFIGIAVSTIFGGAFFFDLFWPERQESPSVKMAWKICSVVISIMALSCAIALTVIVATGRAYIDGISKAQEDLYFRKNGKPNPVYSKNADCIVSVVFLWPGMIACFASTYIMWKSIAHNDRYGPKSAEFVEKNMDGDVELSRNVANPNEVPVEGRKLSVDATNSDNEALRHAGA